MGRISTTGGVTPILGHVWQHHLGCLPFLDVRQSMLAKVARAQS